MAREIDLLIVSSRLGVKRTLLRFLEGLRLNLYAVANVEEAEEIFHEREIDVVVCDEHVSDGTYHDVLALTLDRKPQIQFILLLCTGAKRNTLKRRDWGLDMWSAPRCTQPISNWHSFTHCSKNRLRCMR